MNYKPINLERDTKLIKRYLSISKPLGVSEIKFNLEPTGDNGEYYIRIMYIVPEDSEYLKPDKPNTIPVNYRDGWNKHIQKDIYDFFGLKIIINNSGTRSEKFNYD